MRTDQGQPIRLEDYQPADFLIHHVDMTVQLFDGRVEIDSVLEMERRPGRGTAALLELEGDELELASLALDGSPLSTDRYNATPDRLSVEGLPASGRFRLAIGTRLAPEDNTKLMGLYRSSGIWCTQCEAEGFRRITYFLDRPDVLATYRVRLEADRSQAPVLLSNGNPAEAGDLPDGRHFAVWDDPFPKPSYLFALVAGDLDVLSDSFRTLSGRDVALAIYTEKGQAGRAAYAMDALKRSMRWDETRFGREYDLDVFSVVAISDFNMGAMENKGLNIFNHKYVLLDPDAATDGDYAGVETVIAHEYFHNWTGNRITCRNWFQLCLKEGLTVYRDQEFSADERSRAVKRITTTRNLKAHQFPEDQGPLQHPVRPEQYREINNFYTSTVYDKGAEVVRMLETILGRDGFRAGMDLYFERHDGDAATIEDFLRCFEDATGKDLAQFALWYHQAGTPTLTVEDDFDPARGRLTLTLRQSLQPGAARTGTEPMYLPVRFGLVGHNGGDLEARPTGTAEVVDDVIHLREREATLVFEGLSARPYLSILRDFSAPVTLRMDERREDRLALARLDPAPFNRWRALSDLLGETLRDGARAMQAGRPAAFGPDVASIIAATAADEALDPALRAEAIALPSETEIARLIERDVDPDAVHAARTALLGQIGTHDADLFADLRERLSDAGAFSPDAASAGRRALRNVALGYLSAAEGRPDVAARQFETADNMTDRFAALAVLCQQFPGQPETEAALAAFYTRHRHDPLVIDKWFAIQAVSPHAGTLDRVAALAGHADFTLRNPNRARSLVGSFAAGNPVAFNRADGEGYRWVADRLLAIDKLNPQLAARLATSFRSWQSLELARREQAKNILKTLAESNGISVDLRDIVDRSRS
ncbi:aminopeptidase N [Aurantimonas sp. MSK8Z-1]|uniref:aminopeptidase N n=1 Tax=Mangrovibrevibacter kandeliae TaxID=2968473 RepID=UPI00211960FF|nr:aminopeptidase N [Aurantimonas sp. MSK8Z-1]MCW4113885.1 aminopeptidase N [Aurantimonas sp. MSK8Z-1]